MNVHLTLSLDITAFAFFSPPSQHLLALFAQITDYRISFLRLRDNYSYPRRSVAEKNWVNSKSEAGEQKQGWLLGMWATRRLSRELHPHSFGGAAFTQSQKKCRYNKGQSHKKLLILTFRKVLNAKMLNSVCGFIEIGGRLSLGNPVFFPKPLNQHSAYYFHLLTFLRAGPQTSTSALLTHPQCVREC